MTPINFLFGLGLFLYGMSQLEFGIRKLSDVRLRGWLRASTGTSVSSVTTGVLATALLQSSSMVSLLVLAFASAGLVPFVNAVGIILGANLGTTVTGWLVTIFGFKLSLESMALPLLGGAGFALAFSRQDSRLHFYAAVVLGIGLLLFGLGIMKSSMETLPERFDVAILQGHPAVLYLVFGVVIAALIQSSSAVMMMALAAVNAQFIALPEAIALVIGADLGTTSTTMLGSVGGSEVKRQLALAHLLFNLIVNSAAFLLLLPALPLLLTLLRISDPLIGLVAFHSTMNAIGLLAFIPLLRSFAGWIERLFDRRMAEARTLLEKVPTTVVDAALVALHDTVRSISLQAASNAMRAFNLLPENRQAIAEQVERVSRVDENPDFEQGYDDLKRQEGLVLRYLARIELQPLEETDVLELTRLQRIARSAIYCNKTLKDIRLDLRELRLNPAPVMNELYELHRHYHQRAYQRLLDLLLQEHATAYLLEELDAMDQQNDQHYEKSNRLVQARTALEAADTELISLQLNVNREIRLAYRHMLRSVCSLISDKEDSRNDALQSTLLAGN